ncbi:MAG: Gfo/Idh/MocA family oxidoreductase [Gemmatimonadetes bacterium]|jgi:predicted dehydrogenase/aryl-alcohol dehydrogenase-like predicted oxidoreductase|nr:Gfo/Idh/MocA family oxidoreductase [Gemmatimonadota bacterium]
MATLNWGIIGTGAIAQTFAHGLTQSETGQAIAVGSRNQQTADAFGEKYGIPNRHGSYQALLDDDEIQAVYISTPHPFHAEWAIKAAEAGKHILCEKPLGINHAQGMAMIEAARENGVFFMEAFMYRCHPQTAELVRLIKEGAIGEVRMIRSCFGFGGGHAINLESRTLNSSLGGGGILDVGCYPVSMSRLIAGVAEGKPFADPVEVVGVGHLGEESKIDEWTAAVLRFDSGIIAQVATAVRVSPDNSLEIYGSDGRITVANPWVANRQTADQGRVVVTAKGEEQIIDVETKCTSFAYEADRVAAAVAAGEVEGAWPAMAWDDTMGNLTTLDSWRRAIGLTYDLELEEECKPLRGTLAKRDDAPMKYGKVEGLDKPVSKLIMGCDNQQIYAHGAAMWDDWYERGGNAFDTSWVYGGGKMEILLGKWVKARDIREQVVVTVKGAHSPRCLPDLLVQDFHESLERLQFDYADIYIMHRDNLEVPVGEFVDVLNELKDKDLVRGAFGGSNWTIERFEAVNEYASAHGKQGFSVLNNNLSLARMVEPVWGGCIHASDRVSRQWLEETGTTSIAWSSQARGYFLPEGERMKLGADNFACWDAPDNRARRDRAEELAEKKGCTPINIAAAYVINQPFPSFAIIGPRAIQETATSLPALDVELTAEEVAWLWGEE